MMTPSDYLTMYNTAALTTEQNKLTMIGYVVKVMLTNQSAYQLVQHSTGIPWVVIGCIHFRECDQNLTQNLLNGDPLTARTVHVPAGRPVSGTPPFTWPEAAIDAMSAVWKPGTWDIAGMLEFSERYNGLGYQKRGVNSPYVWDFTDQYTSGLFTADGVYNPNAKESRPGVASLLKSLTLKGVSLDFSALGSNQSLLH